jgi:SAM-dependent methyltransferase
VNIEEIETWFKAKRTPSMSKDDAVAFLHNMHPRTRFVKTLPHGACLLDAGAGDGGLEVFRRWPPPTRADLHLYAYSLDKGAQFNAYDGFELGRWEEGPPVFSGIRFDAVFCSHFIERLSDPASFLQWTAQRLGTRGRLYVEWPSPFSTLLPTRQELEQRGIALAISNFHDDAMHKAVHDRSRVVSVLSNAGFFIELQGYVSLPFIEEELLAHASSGLDDPYAIQAAFWSKTRWSQYVVAVRK